MQNVTNTEYKHTQILCLSTSASIGEFRVNTSTLTGCPKKAVLNTEFANLDLDLRPPLVLDCDRLGLSQITQETATVNHECDMQMHC